MNIKICGITNVRDARQAEDAGADYIGLIFAAGSPRRVGLRRAADIVAALTRARPIGVFTSTAPAAIAAIASELNLFAVQVYDRVGRCFGAARHIRAIRVRDRRSLKSLTAALPDYFLVDTYDARRCGGSGRCFDWRLLPSGLGRVILAGGIGPHNAAAAAALRPFALDICSGVERRPGIKDPARLRALFKEVGR